MASEAYDDDFDVIVVGSGFGGSVSALRLVEKGYRVAVLETGRRYEDDTLPKTSWRIHRFLWAPALGLRGIQRISFLGKLAILTGVGVGGGSLVYANTLYRAPDKVYDDAQWAGITDWAGELKQHYDLAEKMLGARTNPGGTLPDDLLLGVAEELGVGHTFRLTPVAVFFGEAGKKVSDPYFGGAGPDRSGCRFCGECMTGCRYGAKNRLDLNYLYLAERNGAVIHPGSKVVDVSSAEPDGYAVTVIDPGRPWRRRRRYHATQVVFAGGALGTQELLHRLRDTHRLDALSPMLGHLTRTNSQSLLCAEATTPDRSFTSGVAITSSIQPDEHTIVEPVRYGPGSNAMGFLATLLTDGDGSGWASLLRQSVRRPREALSLLWRWRWSERAVILVVMQTLDNSVSLRRRKGLFGRRLTARVEQGQQSPTWTPIAHDITRRIATRLNGRSRGSWLDLFGASLTAHPIGGCVIGDSARTGVVDPYHRLYGYAGLHVIDGSTVPANLGANPALTIAALAERAISLWPNHGDADTRPVLGQQYRRMDPIPARRPVLKQR